LFFLLLASLSLPAAGPAVPSGNILFSGIDGASFTMSFTKGNGAQIATNEYVVYAGTGSVHCGDAGGRREVCGEGVADLFDLAQFTYD